MRAGRAGGQAGRAGGRAGPGGLGVTLVYFSVEITVRFVASLILLFQGLQGACIIDTHLCNYSDRVIITM